MGDSPSIAQHVVNTRPRSRRSILVKISYAVVLILILACTYLVWHAKEMWNDVYAKRYAGEVLILYIDANGRMPASWEDLEAYAHGDTPQRRREQVKWIRDVVEIDFNADLERLRRTPEWDDEFNPPYPIVRVRKGHSTAILDEPNYMIWLYLVKGVRDPTPERLGFGPSTVPATMPTIALP